MAEKRKELRNQLRVYSDDFHFKWELAAFNEIPFMTEHPIPSPSFVLGERTESIWQLMVSKEMRTKTTVKDPTWSKNNSSEEEEETSMSEDEASSKPKEKALGFKLAKAEDSSLWEVVKYQVQVKVGNTCVKTEKKTENGNSYYDTENFTYIYESDMEENDLFKEETILIEAMIEYKYVELSPLYLAEERKFFTEDLTHLYRSQKYADVILKAGDSEILAHKSILCARAYGFDCHLQEDPESMKHKIELDLEESVVDAMLAFIYCGGIPIELTLDQFPALWLAAEKYKVHGLSELLNNYFKNNLGPDVCKDCLGMSDSEDIMIGFIRLAEDKIKSIIDKKKCSHKNGLSG